MSCCRTRSRTFYRSKSPSQRETTPRRCAERLVFYCRTTSASTTPCTSRRMCCPTHCATVPRVSRSCEHFPDGFDLHLLHVAVQWKPPGLTGPAHHRSARGGAGWYPLSDFVGLERILRFLHPAPASPTHQLFDGQIDGQIVDQPAGNPLDPAPADAPALKGGKTRCQSKFQGKPSSTSPHSFERASDDATRRWIRIP